MHVVLRAVPSSAPALHVGRPPMAHSPLRPSSRTRGPTPSRRVSESPAYMWAFVPVFSCCRGVSSVTVTSDLPESFPFASWVSAALPRREPEATWVRLSQRGLCDLPSAVGTQQHRRVCGQGWLRPAKPLAGHGAGISRNFQNCGILHFHLFFEKCRVFLAYTLYRKQMRGQCARS